MHGTRLLSVADLQRGGLAPTDIARSVRRGSLIRVGKGHYAPPDLDDDELRRLQIIAAASQPGVDAVVSHCSAGQLFGLPLLFPDDDVIHFSHPRGGGTRRSQRRRHHRIPIPDCDIVEKFGIPATGLPRTIVDIALAGSSAQALTAVDSGLRRGIRRRELEAALVRAGRRVGIARARWAIKAGSRLSESVGESWSRALFLQWPEVPEPDLQSSLSDSAGDFIARSDFRWGRIVGEFDGRVKYGPRLDPKGDAIIAEKRRENRLLDAGFEVVRWGWSDLREPAALRRRLLAALDRQGTGRR